MTQTMTDVHKWVSRFKRWKRDMIYQNDSIEFCYQITPSMISIIRHNPFNRPDRSSSQAWIFGNKFHKLKLSSDFIDKYGLEIQKAFAVAEVESWTKCIIEDSSNAEPQ